MFDDFTIISSYTNEQAIEDGIKVKILDGENGIPDVFATTNCLETVTPGVITDEGLNLAALAPFLPAFKLYQDGTYHDDTADHPEECTGQFAVYSVNGHTVWFMLDGDGMTLLLPEDY